MQTPVILTTPRRFKETMSGRTKLTTLGRIKLTTWYEEKTFMLLIGI